MKLQCFSLLRLLLVGIFTSGLLLLSGCEENATDEFLSEDEIVVDDSPTDENTGGENETPEEEAPPPAESSNAIAISNISLSGYSINSLNVGSAVFSDRSYIINSIPAGTESWQYIQTANSDKANSDSRFLSFTISNISLIYVGFDNRATTLPSWAASWTETGASITTSDATYSLYSNIYDAGLVSLGGNGNSDVSMYMIVVPPDTDAELIMENTEEETPPEEGNEEETNPPDTTPTSPTDNDADVSINTVKEISLSALTTFDGSQGNPNPFTDISVVANLTSPTGKPYSVTGFFDGDGAGSQVGSLFKARVYANELGTWQWSVTSNDNSLSAQTGSFDCVGTASGVFANGPITVLPATPTLFSHSNGTPVFLVGKFLDHSESSPLRYTHTFFSNSLSDDDREAMLANQIAMGVNKINVYLANIGDYNGMSIDLWENNDKTRFDLAKWQMVDTWLNRFHAAGIIAHIWFFADDSNFGGLASSDLERFAGYAMARTSANVHTMFTLALEWQESFSLSKIRSLGEHTQTQNPWDRLISVHELNGDATVYDETWLDFLDTQSGFVDSATIYNFGLRNRAFTSKPLIIEEFSFGEETSANRYKTWAAIMSVPAGIGTGAFLSPLADLVDTVKLRDMEPIPSLTTEPSFYVAGNQDTAYLIYQQAATDLDISLSGVTNNWFGYWINPSNGDRTTATFSATDSQVTATSPSNSDWLFYLSNTQL